MRKMKVEKARRNVKGNNCIIKKKRFNEQFKKVKTCKFLYTEERRLSKKIIDSKGNKMSGKKYRHFLNKIS